MSCFTYDGGISLVPGAEAHGGSCYCGVAALALMQRKLSDEVKDELTRWCMFRQIHGFQGRTNKVADSCYSFWVGATLNLLNEFNATDLDSTRDFLLTKCQADPSLGGFSKTPDAYPDILHTFYSLCWLSMDGRSGLRALNPALGICSDKI